SAMRSAIRASLLGAVLVRRSSSGSTAMSARTKTRNVATRRTATDDKSRRSTKFSMGTRPLGRLLARAPPRAPWRQPITNRTMLGALGRDGGAGACAPAPHVAGGTLGPGHRGDLGQDVFSQFQNPWKIVGLRGIGSTPVTCSFQALTPGNWKIVMPKASAH